MLLFLCCFYHLFFVFIFFLVWLICVLMSFSLYLSCIRLLASWTLVAISFPILGKFLVISSNTFSWPFLLSSSGTPIIWMLGCFMLSQRSLRLSSFFTLYLYSSLLQLLPAFYVSAHLSILLPQLLDCRFPLEHFYSVITLFIIDHLFFNSSKSLSNFYCTPLFMPPVYLSMTSLCLQDFGASLLSLASQRVAYDWVTNTFTLPTVIILNYFSGRLLISSSFVWSGRIYHVPSPDAYFSIFSFCLFYCAWVSLLQAVWL